MSCWSTETAADGRAPMTKCGNGSEYRESHAEDDPDAMHVQVLRLSPWSWLAGGKLVDRAVFLDDA